MTDLKALDGATIAFDLDGTLVESAPDLIGAVNAVLIEAVEAVGGNLTRSIMVGDADTDAGAARAAGTLLILVDFGYTEIPAADRGHYSGLQIKACAEAGVAANLPKSTTSNTKAEGRFDRSDFIYLAQ